MIDYTPLKIKKEKKSEKELWLVQNKRRDNVAKYIYPRTSKRKVGLRKKTRSSCWYLIGVGSRLSSMSPGVHSLPLWNIQVPTLWRVESVLCGRWG